MIAYVGQTRSRKLIATLSAAGIGECVCPEEVPPKRTPWFLDNGAFRDWKAGRPWNSTRFESALADPGPVPPLWVVAPDIVAGGLASLERSRSWLGRLPFPAFLAVQDGMEAGKVDPEGFSGIFVGGTLPWKMATGASWVVAAHKAGLPCHVGRVGTASRVRWAKEIGVDSIDSCLPLWSRGNLRSFLSALEGDGQRRLFS